MRILILIIFLMALCTSKILIAQSYKVMLLDEVTKKPVDFAFVFSATYNTLSDSAGIFLIPKCSREDSFTISHINYQEYIINCSTIKKLDTFYISPNSYRLDEIAIVEKKSKTDLYDLLNNILKKYRKSDYSERLSYNYILRTLKRNKIVERINSNLTINYKVGDIAVFPNKWLNYGTFEFTEEAPFLSLDIEQLVFGLQPFHRGENYNLITVEKLRKKDCSIEIVNCSSCTSDQIRLKVKSNQQRCFLTIDLVKKQILEGSYIIDKKANLSFIRLADKSSLSVEKFTLNIKLDEHGVPHIIDGEISLKNQSVSYKTIFVLYKNKKDRTLTYNILGKPSFDNIYQQLIFQPNNIQKPIDTINALKDESLLAQFNDNFRKQFLESSLFGSRYLYLDKEIDSIPIDIRLIDEPYYINSLGKVINFKNDLIVYQPYRKYRSKGEDTIVSIMPIIDLGRSRIFSKTNDPYINQWTVLLMCYLYELDRQSLGKSFPVTDTIETIDTYDQLQAKFSKNRSHYNEILDGVLIENNIPVRGLVGINHLIDSMININIFKHVIAQDYGCHECKDELLHQIIRHGFIMKMDGRPENEISIYFEYGLAGLNQLKNELSKDDTRYTKLLASYYSRMGELHIELKNNLEACKCIEKYKTLWLEAYMQIKKLNSFYDENCKK